MTLSSPTEVDVQIKRVYATGFELKRIAEVRTGGKRRVRARFGEAALELVDDHNVRWGTEARVELLNGESGETIVAAVCRAEVIIGIESDYIGLVGNDDDFDSFLREYAHPFLYAFQRERIIDATSWLGIAPVRLPIEFDTVIAEGEPLNPNESALSS
jgi:hypothetical protein